MSEHVQLVHAEAVSSSNRGQSGLLFMTIEIVEGPWSPARTKTGPAALKEVASIVHCAVTQVHVGTSSARHLKMPPGGGGGGGERNAHPPLPPIFRARHEKAGKSPRNIQSNTIGARISPT